MKIEQYTTRKAPLPRTWWRSNESRDRDLTAAKARLDREEQAWNAMVRAWSFVGGEGPPPPPSPHFQQGAVHPKIQTFP